MICNSNAILRGFVMLNRNFVEHWKTKCDSHGDLEKKISFLFSMEFGHHGLNKASGLMWKKRIKLRDSLNSGIF